MAYPPCQAKNRQNHNGGGELGPLYITDEFGNFSQKDAVEKSRPPIAFACDSCCTALGLKKVKVLPL